MFASRATQAAPRPTAPKSVPARASQSPVGNQSRLRGLAAPPIVQQAVDAPGRPLDGTVRARMEPHFGRSFSHVRVHDDATGAAAAEAIGANAFASGHNIAFAPGRYAPGTATGDRLIAHELAHVAQADAPNVVRGISRKPTSRPRP
jgi:hypothetical protein